MRGQPLAVPLMEFMEMIGLRELDGGPALAVLLMKFMETIGLHELDEVLAPSGAPHEVYGNDRFARTS